MPRKEGPFSHGETLSPPEQHRLDGEGPAEALLFQALERQFGPDVVDDPNRAAELHKAAVAQRLAQTAEFRPTPEKLRYDRQIEFGLDLDQAAPFSPLAGVVDVPSDTQFPAQFPAEPVPSQPIQQLAGGQQ